MPNINKLPDDKKYEKLLTAISNTFHAGRTQAIKAINVQLLKTNWEIGRYIVEFEQGGKGKAEYGKALLKKPIQRP